MHSDLSNYKSIAKWTVSSLELLLSTMDHDDFFPPACLHLKKSKKMFGKEHINFKIKSIKQVLQGETGINSCQSIPYAFSSESPPQVAFSSSPSFSLIIFLLV